MPISIRGHLCCKPGFRISRENLYLGLSWSSGPYMGHDGGLSIFDIGSLSVGKNLTKFQMRDSVRKYHINLGLTLYHFEKYPLPSTSLFFQFLVSVPLQMLKPYAFLSMLMEILLAVVTHYMKKPWGNICMWLLLVLGQPLAIMMYYYDYLIAQNLIDVTSN